MACVWPACVAWHAAMASTRHPAPGTSLTLEAAAASRPLALAHTHHPPPLPLSPPITLPPPCTSCLLTHPSPTDGQTPITLYPHAPVLLLPPSLPPSLTHCTHLTLQTQRYVSHHRCLSFVYSPMALRPPSQSTASLFVIAAFHHKEVQGGKTGWHLCCHTHN